MALTSTLGSPGIEIREVDNSIRLDSSTATTIYVPGFAAQGPVDEVMSIGSIGDFELIYGVPTNAAERYFYYTVKAILDNSGNGATVLCSRMPYGEKAGDTVSNAYTMLVYPAVPVIKKKYYKKYSCLTEDNDSYSINFNIDGTTVTYTCDKNNPDVSENWNLQINNENTSNYTYTFSILPDDKGYELKSSSEEVSTVLNSEIYYDFDQFIINERVEDDLKSLFSTLQETTIQQTTDENGKTVETTVTTDYKFDCEIQDLCMSLDDDYAKEMTDINIKSFNADDNASSIPKVGAMISDEKSGWNNEDFNAPEIEFDTGNANTLPENKQEFIAKGLMATEAKDGEYFVHFSYTIFENKEDENKVGSLYFKVRYTSENIQSKDFKSEKISINSALTFVEAFEIADSYDGKRRDTKNEVYSYDEPEKFAKDVTYVIGSPVTYQISLSDYYKVITGESLKWSRKPYRFTNSEEGDDSVPEGDDDEGVSKTPVQFGIFNAIGHAAFIVINTGRTINNNNFEGYYLGLNDNTFVTPESGYGFDCIENVKVTTETFTPYRDTDGKLKQTGLMDTKDNTGDYHSLNKNRLSFQLTSNSQGSISKVLSRDITTMDISTSDYDDTISMALFKLTKVADNSDVLKLNYTMREKYNWSIGNTRLKSINGSTSPVSYFAENIVENSNNLTVLINPHISKMAYVDTDSVLHGKIRIFSPKLLRRLEHFESKYLRRDYSSLDSGKETKNREIPAAVPAKLAQSSIQSWKDMVKQVGLTPHFIKYYFRNYDISYSSTGVDDYKNFHPLNSLMPFGAYTPANDSNKVIGAVPIKLERALQLVENDELYPDIDIILESGLGTIYVNSMGDIDDYKLTSEYRETGTHSEQGEGTNNNIFDENVVINGIEDLRTSRTALSENAQNAKENYNAVQNVFLQFANSMQNGGRGDCFYISDIPRGILIKGKDTKIVNLFGSRLENNAYDFDENVNHSFPTSVYYPIYHTFDNIVSSYASTYAQWVKILDAHSSQKVWIPISGYIAANMAATDGTYGPWYAAAGLRRGVINGVLDYAISPTINQRTDLYKICINSVPKIPNYGVTIWGIRTMSKKDSAFDQNTCRRTFLYMEKKVKQLLRYYLFEPNTSYTRLQIFNDIDPFLEKIKNNGGIYSYKLVTDTTINTPDVINNGDLAVQIAAAPTRTAENIVVEFIANKYTEEVSASESIK